MVWEVEFQSIKQEGGEGMLPSEQATAIAHRMSYRLGLSA